MSVNVMMGKVQPEEYLRRVYRTYRGIFRSRMQFPTYGADIGRMVAESADPVRYASVALALRRIDSEGVHGGLAELGVWKGRLSWFIHNVLPSRDLYLFDTFNGFDKRDTVASESDARRFRDTNAAAIARVFSGSPKVHIVPGWFPQTASIVSVKQFSFVMIDFDVYEPTKAALEFFYPRLSAGGYIFLHDYNSPESQWAVRRATDEFLARTPEQVVEIPDLWGSVVIRKTVRS